MNQVGISFVVFEKERNLFNSMLSARGLRTKEVMTTFVHKLLSNPKETLTFLGFEVEND